MGQGLINVKDLSLPSTWHMLTTKLINNSVTLSLFGEDFINQLQGLGGSPRNSTTVAVNTKIKPQILVRKLARNMFIDTKIGLNM